MSYATVRAAIKTELEGVAGITGSAGKVVDHEPHFDRIEELRSFFSDTPATLVNGWTIHRENSIDTQEESRGKRWLVTHSIVVRGYNQLEEGSTSATDFQDLIDAVKTALRTSTTIWPVFNERNNRELTTQINDSTLASVLVHNCEIRFEVDEIEVSP